MLVTGYFRPGLIDLCMGDIRKPALYLLYKGSLGGDGKSPRIGSPTERGRVVFCPEIRQWKRCQHRRKILFYSRISRKRAF